jgi:hypothetical protein
VLVLAVEETNALLNWSSPTPAFVPQQTSKVGGSVNGWVDVTNPVSINGSLNSASIPRAPGASQ